MRAPWFEVSCCPPNVARTLAGLAAYVATADDEGLQLHQFAAATIRTALPGGTAVALDVETGYPRDGLIRVNVREDADTPWTLTLRVPAWAERARLVVRPVGAAPDEQVVRPGAVPVRRAFRRGDVVELQLPVAPRFTAADPRIDAVRGCLAVERGPEVLCLESVDLAAVTAGRITDVGMVRLDPRQPPREVGPDVVVRLRPLTTGAPTWPYAEPGRAPSPDGVGFDVPLVPYHDWAERGPSTMRVWLPTDPE